MRSLRLATVLLATLTFPAVAFAGPGLRLGLTNNPDSIFAGLQWKAPIAQVGPGRLGVQPGADIGLVDGPVDLFIRGTLHFTYVVPLTHDIQIYPLAGPTLFWAKAGDNSDTDFGVDVGGGIQFQKFALELWFGAVDSADATLAVSFNL